MFIVLNKEKIYTYVISIATVVMLFGIANILYIGEKAQTQEIGDNQEIADSQNASNNQEIANSQSISNNQEIISSQEVVSSQTKKLPIYNVETKEKKVAFTMNCAWTADDIDTILEVLERQNVKITFFIVGEWVDKNPEAVKKIYEAGHEIGSHSDTHPHVNNLSYEKNQKQIADSVEKIKKITGGEVTLYRAPYGEYNDTVIEAAEKAGYYCIQWNRDTLDYEGLTGEEMWKRIENKLQNGDIILSHNGTKHTADSIEMLIKKIKEKGYEIVKVSDIIYKENYIINSNGTQQSK